MEDKKHLTYRDAGVDIDQGNALISDIAPLARATRRRGAAAALGGFGALFDLKPCGFTDPLLVAACDGVGTKLKIALAVGEHHGIGIDLVAMSVNDLIVQGAEPLFFLDYFATGRLDRAIARTVIAGIAAGCREAGCALIGGETAEMPGLYAAGDYDLAGFAVGAVERERLLPCDHVAPGDVILGLPSSGLHANGFSLVRKIVERAGLSYAQAAPFATGQTLATALLTPTRLYVRPLLEVLRKSRSIKALAHVTGGGFVDNIPRVLPEGCAARLDLTALPEAPLYSWLADAGGIAVDDMLRTFNCGIGMIVVVAAEEADHIRRLLEEAGETPLPFGHIEQDSEGPRTLFSGKPYFSNASPTIR